MGLDCGKSRIFVVDIDPRHGGDETLLDLFGRYGRAWAETVTATTGGGGQHYYFRNNADLTNAVDLGPGIDCRGVGGFVVVPPSAHISGRDYEWEYGPHELAIAPLPMFVIESASKKPVWLPNGVIHEGSRNTSLTSLAGKLRHLGLEAEAIFQALRVQANVQCEQPETVSDAELWRMANWVGRRPTGQQKRAMALAREDEVHRRIVEKYHGG